MSIESYIHGVGNHHEAETFYIQKQAIVHKRNEIFGQFPLAVQETHGKHVFNGSPKIGIHDKKR